MKAPGLREFKDFMQERHAIYLRRAAGEPWPWTEDDALRHVYVINVYRELDKVTVWIRENIRERYADNPNLWFMLVIARLLNLPESLQDLMDNGVWPEKEWNKWGFQEVLEARQKAGLTNYSAAYVTWGGDEKGRPKFDLHGEHLTHMWHGREQIESQIGDTLEKAWRELIRWTCIGGFTAYEVVSDLRHTRYLAHAPDTKTWAYAGPGCKRGLNWVFGRPPNSHLADRRALQEMRALYENIAPQWEHEPPLEMREIEHSLCEFSKVMAYRYLGKRPKRWYRRPER